MKVIRDCYIYKKKELLRISIIENPSLSLFLAKENEINTWSIEGSIAMWRSVFDFQNDDRDVVDSIVNKIGRSDGIFCQMG